MIPAIQTQTQEESVSQMRIVPDFYVEPTSTTPLIQFDPSTRVLHFEGKSSPENAPKFYEAIHDWFKSDEFNGASVTVNMSLTYFNTSSCKCLFIIFKKLNEFRSSGMDVLVNWFYEEDDDDMIEAGEDFSEIFDMNFNLIELED